MTDHVPLLVLPHWLRLLDTPLHWAYHKVKGVKLYDAVVEACISTEVKIVPCMCTETRR